MTILAQTSLLSALITGSIAFSIFLRGRRTKAQSYFAYFNINLCAALLATFLISLGDLLGSIGLHSLMLLSLGLPVTGLRFFALFLPDLEKAVSRMLGICYPLTVVFAGIAVTPLSRNLILLSAHIAYVLLIFTLCFLFIFLRYQASEKPGERTRLRPVGYGGFIVITLIILDLVSYQLDWPYVFLANIGLAVYMYYTLQILLTVHAFDISELIGKGVVLGVLSFVLAMIFWLLTFWADTKQIGSFFFSVLVASIVILILYDPLKHEVEARAAEFFFRQKRELRILIERLRRDLVNVIDLEKTARIIVTTLERSGRATHASFYLLREDGSGYERLSWAGKQPIYLIEKGRHASFLQNLQESLGPVIKQDLEFRYTSSLFHLRGEGENLHEEERLLEILRTLEQLHADYSLPCIGSDQEILGFINLKDDRFEDSYSQEELSFIMMVAAQAAITIENSRIFEQVKERERLAALGEMSAGLAHEIRNPLGAIKGAAQLLDPKNLDESDREMLSIILEEVDRLNSVVSQFLDYARPMRSGFELTDIHQILKRTSQLFDAEFADTQRKLTLHLDEDVPLIYADAEKLKQVFINLIRNSLEAIEENNGHIAITTHLTHEHEAPYIELIFDDDGPGIPLAVMKNLFIPFFTTKDKGTGLGLSICQRIIESHDGTIQVQSSPEQGARFVIRLPVQRTPPPRIDP
ncbi:ATP-binding protein [Myxococcota bacterium]|nr:ATP-binding protein [Myxococcota bacterium]